MLERWWQSESSPSTPSGNFLIYFSSDFPILIQSYNHLFRQIIIVEQPLHANWKTKQNKTKPGPCTHGDTV